MRLIIFQGALALVAVAGMAAARAQVVAQPSEITFTRSDQTHQVSLTHEGKPLTEAEIGASKIYIEKNDYDEFFTIRKGAGVLTITPTAQVELSTYEWVIQTTYGPVTVRVLTPLQDDPNSIENRAKQLGITVEELKIRLGLFTKGPREDVTLMLPGTYYTGQSLKVSMDKKPGRTYTWRVNNQVVAEGPDANTLNYTFTQAGPQIIEYTASENGGVVASAIASTNVVALEGGATLAPAASLAPATIVVLRAPDGYTKYVWKADGKVLQEGAELRHDFGKPGSYLVVLEAGQPVLEGLPATKSTEYHVVVVEQEK